MPRATITLRGRDIEILYQLIEYEDALDVAWACRRFEDRNFLRRANFTEAEEDTVNAAIIDAEGPPWEGNLNG